MSNKTESKGSSSWSEKYLNLQSWKVKLTTLSKSCLSSRWATKNWDSTRLEWQDQSQDLECLDRVHHQKSSMTWRSLDMISLETLSTRPYQNPSNQLILWRQKGLRVIWVECMEDVRRTSDSSQRRRESHKFQNSRNVCLMRSRRLRASTLILKTSRCCLDLRLGRRCLLRFNWNLCRYSSHMLSVQTSSFCLKR